MSAQFSANSNIEEEKEEDKKFQKKFNRQFELNLEMFKEGRYLQEEDCKFMSYLGALLNDTIYRQQKYFKTSGLLKQIVPFYKYISKNKAEVILNTCIRLQRSISRTKKIPMSPLKNETERLFKALSEEDFTSSDEDLTLCLVMGYNIYSKAIFKVISEKESYIPNYNELWNLSNYKDSNSFKIGFLLAIYFYKIEEMQRNHLKTMSLLKDLMRFLRKPELREVKKFLREINSVVLKVHSTIRFKSRDTAKIQSFLPGDFIQLNLFEFLNKHSPSEIDNKDIFLGFIAGFIWRYHFRFYKIELGLEPVNQVNEPERLQKNGQIIVTEEQYINSLKKKDFQNKNEETAYLLGILFQAISNDEEKRLQTSSLLKKFSFLFRNFKQKNIKLTYFEIFRTYIKLWIKKIKTTFNPKEQTVKYFSKFPHIGAQLVMNFGRKLDGSNKDAMILAFIQGYDSFGRLYRKLNQ